MVIVVLRKVESFLSKKKVEMDRQLVIRKEKKFHLPCLRRTYDKIDLPTDCLVQQ